MIPYTRDILDAAAPREDDRVFLKVMPLTGDVSVHFDMIGETYTSNLAKRRVRLFWGRGKNPDTHAAPLWALLQCACLAS
jgi:hypothetical protein